MIRAERVERFLMDRRTAYEAGEWKRRNATLHTEVLPDHWVDLAQGIAAGCTSSELRVAKECRDDLMDYSKDDVTLGIEIASKVRPGDQVFSATVTDSDDRDLHFFFIAQSEDELFERVRAALEGDRS